MAVEHLSALVEQAAWELGELPRMFDGVAAKIMGNTPPKRPDAPKNGIQAALDTLAKKFWNAVLPSPKPASAPAAAPAPA
jgi:hypothetical protein